MTDDPETYFCLTAAKNQTRNFSTTDDDIKLTLSMYEYKIRLLQEFFGGLWGINVFVLDNTHNSNIVFY
ncbi:unnamed protein product [Schistosoma rodhaini]|uniref:Uncharacterized protein n=1 Tax=Schistosoma rodhaini TaxID=6188 RepID=A0AA85FYB1_9TREM|nr:unnamed protein product [Schistosoma rodhaini]